MGATKLTGKVAEVGWKFTEVASQKVTEVSGAVSEKVPLLILILVIKLIIKPYFLFFKLCYV